MWQRFTERARKCVFYAQEEAGRLGENYVSTEHILLGLLREDDSVAAKIIDRIGVGAGRIREEIERQVARGDGKLGQDMQLTPRAKRVIDLGYDEARQLNNNYIGTEHLLLGLIREGEGLAGRVLAKLGFDVERVRSEIITLQAGRVDHESGGTQLPRPRSVLPDSTVAITKAANDVVAQARIHARMADQPETYPDHLLFALLSMASGSARRLIERLCVDVTPLLTETLTDDSADEHTEGPPLSASSVECCRLAESLARYVIPDTRIGSDHLLLALTAGTQHAVLESIGLTYDKMVSAIREMRDEEA